MNIHTPDKSFSRERRAGVLLHPTSFPGEMQTGDIGHQAYRFIEFLSANGYKVWQMLPLGATHNDHSPYQCLSSHAGNPLLISLHWLVDRGWLDGAAIQDGKKDDAHRRQCLKIAAENFYRLNDPHWQQKLTEFKQKNGYWLDDYLLFMALKWRNQNRPWYEWPAAERHRETDRMQQIRKEYQQSIRQTLFEQFVFFSQWAEIHDYARQHNIELFGDIPIFVARDSADVWAEKENFLIDEDGQMEVTAGVPPDAFSDTGQRWGNPLYNWEYMRATDFSWWKARFRTQLEFFDLLRIDHFRGLQACWYIPESDDTAIHGEWVEVPGREMLSTLFADFDYLPLVAEDLGVITDPVIELKKDFQLPGMKVLQFAFDGNNRNPHLPHCHEQADVIYTGTHDNDTSLGWASNMENYNTQFFRDYLGCHIDSSEQAALALVRLAMASVSFLCIIPMQDILLLDSSARMNIPGTTEGNWNWRFEWQQLRPEINQAISHYMKLYQR